MRTEAAWTTRSIFVTSTFRDMHSERDHLRTIVVPELEERLNRRRCHVESIDLRWGVETLGSAEAQAKELLVLRVCLAEVERSQPYLIALIGDRYGWIPPAERMYAAAAEMGIRHDVAGYSLTELEIEHGALSRPAAQRRCFFYLRDPLPYGDMSPEVAARYCDEFDSSAMGAEATRRLRALKARIEREAPDRIRRYSARWDPDAQAVTGLEAWGAQVLEDLWRELAADTQETVRSNRPGWQQEERFAQEAFAKELTRKFVGREDLLGPLTRDALEPRLDGKTWGVCLTGVAGSGKSSVIAELSRRLGERENVLVLGHAAGPTPQSGRVSVMLRLWVDLLASSLGELPSAQVLDDYAQLVQAFRQLFARRCEQHRTVLLIDGLDEFEGGLRAAHMTWLPTPWPANARLIVACAPGEAAQALGARKGIRTLALPALTRDVAEAIVLATCERYHRTINADVLAALLDARGAGGRHAWELPLWISVAAEQINRLDSSDFAAAEKMGLGTAEERLKHMLLEFVRDVPPEIEGLLGLLVARGERLHGNSMVGSLLALIAVSRSGWNERELRALLSKLAGLELDSLAFARLRRTFRGHLVQHGMRREWSFSHERLRSAVLGRYLGDAARRRALHAQIADHLLSLRPTDEVARRERMFHLIRAGDRERAARNLVAAFVEQAAESAFIEARAAEDDDVGALADHASSADAAGDSNLEWVLSLMYVPLPSIAQQLMLLFKLYQVDCRLEHRASLSLRRRLLLPLVERMQPFESLADHTSWCWQLACMRVDLSEVLAEEGGAVEALELRRRALEIEQRESARLPHVAAFHEAVAASHAAIADLLIGLQRDEEAHSSIAGLLEVIERLVGADPGNTHWRRKLCLGAQEMARVLLGMGDAAAALPLARKYLEGTRQLARREPRNYSLRRDLALAEHTLGAALDGTRASTEALSHFVEANRLWQEVAREDPSDLRVARGLLYAQRGLAELEIRLGDITVAEEIARDALAAAQRILQRDLDSVAAQRDLYHHHELLGKVLLHKGDPAQALGEFQAALMTCMRVCHLAAGDSAARLHAVALRLSLCEALAGAGRGREALEPLDRALQEADRIAAEHTGDVAPRRLTFSILNLRGELLEQRGDLGEARRALGDCAARVEALARDHPERPGYRRDVGVAYLGLADLETRAGEPKQALEHLDAAWTAFTALHDRPGGDQDLELADDLASCQRKRAAAWEALGDPERAGAAHGDARARLVHLLEHHPAHLRWSARLAMVLESRAALAERLGRRESARADWREARSVLLRALEVHADNPQLARGLLRVGEHLAADLRQAGGSDDDLELRTHTVGVLDRCRAGAPDVAHIQANLAFALVKLARCLHQRGQDDEARPCWQRAEEILDRMRANGTMSAFPGLAQMLQALESPTAEPTPEAVEPRDGA